MAIYEFNYTTPVPAPTDTDPNAVVQVPSTFALAGIAPDVAKCLRFGLRRGVQLGLIANVDVQQVTENRMAFTADPTAPV